MATIGEQFDGGQLSIICPVQDEATPDWPRSKGSQSGRASDISGFDTYSIPLTIDYVRL